MNTAKKFDYEKAFCRNLGLFDLSEQQKLRNLRVGIPGMGGVGGIHLITLIRMGVGAFHIADSDTFEISNFNRQYGATVKTIGQDKSSVMAERAREINPEVKLRVWNEYVGEKNIDDFLDGCDVIVDGIDAFAVKSRRLLFEQALSRGIPVITAGPIGFSSALLVFRPGSMSVSKYFDFQEDLPKEELFIRFLAGLTPTPLFLQYLKKEYIDVKNQKGPSVASSVSLCAGFAAVEVAKQCLGRGKVYAAPYFHYFDPYLMRFLIRKLPFGNRGPLQKIKLKLMRKALSKRKSP